MAVGKTAASAVKRSTASKTGRTSARKLAADMLTVVPEMLTAYKGLIDNGYATSFGDGLLFFLVFGGGGGFFPNRVSCALNFP